MIKKILKHKIGQCREFNRLVSFSEIYPAVFINFALSDLFGNKSSSSKQNTLYPFQIKVLNEMNRNKRCAFYKARNMGFTTMGFAYAVWECLLHEDRNVLMTFPTRQMKRASIKGQSHKLDYFYLKSIAENEIRFKNGSILHFKSDLDEYDKGMEAYDHLIIDEHAFYSTNPLKKWPNTNKITSYTSVTGDNDNTQMESFEKFAFDARTFKKRIDYTFHPDRDQDWFEQKVKQMGKTHATREYKTII